MRPPCSIVHDRIRQWKHGQKLAGFCDFSCSMPIALVEKGVEKPDAPACFRGTGASFRRAPRLRRNTGALRTIPREFSSPDTSAGTGASTEVPDIRDVLDLDVLPRERRVYFLHGPGSGMTCYNARSRSVPAKAGEAAARAQLMDAPPGDGWTGSAGNETKRLRSRRMPGTRSSWRPRHIPENGANPYSGGLV